MAAVEDLTGKFVAFSIGKEKTPTAWSGSSPATQLLRREDHTRPNPPPPSQAKRPLNEEKEDANKGRAPSQDDDDLLRLKKVVRKKNYELIERVRGRTINLLQGLELHCNVFNPMEQKKIVDCIYDFQEKGRRGELRERTYSEPRKWMRGKGRITIQFGCCYNYAVDKDGNPPGIIRDEYVDPIPPLLKNMIKRMVAWHVLPPTCIPNSCIVNIYDKDDCIPPHIDHHDFLRPFCTVSFLTECNILFGSELKVLGPGDFSGSTAISLPLGSVLILNGNGADVAKHCVPAVPARRISITFRKMDERKIPYKFKPDPELQNLRPLVLSKSPSQQVGVAASPVQRHQAPSPQAPSLGSNGSFQGQKDIVQVTPSKSGSPFQFGDLDFPPLGSSSSSGRRVTRSIRQ